MTRQSSGDGGYGWVVLGDVFLVQAAISMAVYSFGPLAPFLLDAFGMSRVQVGLFSSLIFLAMVLFGMPAGWLVDRFGVRRLLLVGPGMFALVFALFSQITSVSIGYFVVILAGFGYVFVTPTTTMALVHYFPPRRRATAISIKQSAVTVGSAVGAIIVPYLANWLGWRSTVALLGAAVVVVVAASFTIYRDATSQPSVAQAPVLATFRRVLANRGLLHLGLTAIVYCALQMGLATYLVLQLVEARQLSVVVAGTFLMAANLGGGVGRVLWGFISDRAFGGQRRPVLVIIGIIAGTIAIVFSTGIATMPLWLLYLISAVFGATALGWNGVLITFASEISGKDLGAAGLGWAVTLMTIGILVGPPLFGYIVDRTSSYNPAWLVFGILTLVATVSMIFIREHKASK